MQCKRCPFSSHYIIPSHRGVPRVNVALPTWGVSDNTGSRQFQLSERTLHDSLRTLKIDHNTLQGRAVHHGSFHSSGIIACGDTSRCPTYETIWGRFDRLNQLKELPKLPHHFFKACVSALLDPGSASCTASLSIIRHWCALHELHRHRDRMVASPRGRRYPTSASSS